MEVSYRKSVIENSDSEMEVDMELKLNDENMVVKSPKAAEAAKKRNAPLVGKVAKAHRSPKAARKLTSKTEVKKTVSKKKDGVKEDTMKTKAKPKAKAVESKSKGKTTAEMVFEALGSLKSRKGITMASIRNYLSKNFGIEGTKRDTFIKNALRASFADKELGNLEPSDDGELKFNKRFWFTPKK